jgi:protein-tyrosine phosphatase
MQPESGEKVNLCGEAAMYVGVQTGPPRRAGMMAGMQKSVRILPMTGASNFRDLGGFPTSDGGSTRWGRLFRSDTLHELTPGDVAALRDLGLKTVIDLRTNTEVELTGRGLLGAEAAAYFHLSVIDEDGGEGRGIPAPTDDDISNRYLWYLEIGRDALSKALMLIGDPANYPLVFHCAAGKDRTGVLAALVLDIAGVERESIVEDYVLTASRMELILTRLLRNAADGQGIDNIPAKARLVEASTMVAFLEGLDHRYGGARQWALSAGVPHDTLDAISAAIVSTEAL